MNRIEIDINGTLRELAEATGLYIPDDRLPRLIEANPQATRLSLRMMFAGDLDHDFKPGVPLAHRLIHCYDSSRQLDGVVAAIDRLFNVAAVSAEEFEEDRFLISHAKEYCDRGLEDQRAAQINYLQGIRRQCVEYKQKLRAYQESQLLSSIREVDGHLMVYLPV